MTSLAVPRTDSALSRRKLVVGGAAVAAAGALGGFAAWRLAPDGSAQAGIPVEGRPPAAEIALTDHHGRPFRLSALRGSAVLLFFGYTSCKDVCPITLATWQQAARSLGPDAERVRFLMVSVDPIFDTPERLRAHLERIDPRFTGLTGTIEEVERVLALYSAYVREAPGEQETVDGRRILRHTPQSFAIDPAGRLAVVFRYATPAAGIADDLRRLLRA